MPGITHMQSANGITTREASPRVRWGDKLHFHGMSDHTHVPVFDYDSTGMYPKDNEYLEHTFSIELFTNAAVNFIEDYQEKQPFFLYVAYTAPHDPRTAPELYASMYDKSDITLPPNFMREHPFDTGDMVVRDEKLAGWPRDEDKIWQHMADYYGMISHLDAQIGRVIDALKAKGVCWTIRSLSIQRIMAWQSGNMD